MKNYKRNATLYKITNLRKLQSWWAGQQPTTMGWQTNGWDNSSDQAQKPARALENEPRWAV